MQADRPQQPLERVAKRDIVINDQDGGPCVRHRCYSRSKDHGDEPLSIGPRGLSPPLQKSYSLASAPIPQTGDRRRGPKGMPLTQPLSTSLSGAAAGRGPVRGGKQLPFLATKVVPPRCPGLIDRPRLMAVASRLSAKRLAVIKAPAGF